MPSSFNYDKIEIFFFTFLDKVTVNATCGEGIPNGDRYCKLVGYDRLEIMQQFEILDGQVIKIFGERNVQRWQILHFRSATLATLPTAM